MNQFSPSASRADAPTSDHTSSSVSTDQRWNEAEITVDSFPDQPSPREAFAAALWDFDGTLVDSEPTWQGAVTEMMAEFGHEWTAEEHQQLIGKALLDSAAIMIDTAGRHDLAPAEVVDDLVQRVAKKIREAEIAWVPGALPMLEALSRAQVPCALVSASYRPVLEAVLDRLPGLFEVVVAGDDVTHGKPDPEPYLRASALLGVRSGDCIVFEDSLPGTASGQSSGATVIAVRNHIDLPTAPRRVNLNTLQGQSPESLVPQVIAAREVAATEGTR